MQGVADQISKVLGVDQADEDEDVNVPLKRSKRGKRGGGRDLPRSALTGTGLTVCLGVFAVVLVAGLAYGATVGTAETAWWADGMSGTFWDPKPAVVLHNVHEQNADWGKTRAISSPGKTKALEAKVKRLEAELHSQKGTRHNNGDGQHWGHHDYSNEVYRKERAEEARIRRKVHEEDKDRLHVDSLGLDKKHRRILRQMKENIHEQNSYARKAARADFKRRQAEINEIMPEDDNCPGPNCLRVTDVDRSQHRTMKVVHKYPPWHHNYPPEMSNVYSDNKAGVKVSRTAPVSW